MNDEDLRQVFEEFGDVNSAKIIMDKETGRSRGFGFVEMANDEDGKEAIAALNGADFNGMNIIVNEAKPKEDNNNRPPRKGGFQKRY